uniref:(northern house mosquito) hypothetical protein n=1 Tax=Culex pipiens TaxID=7175 RepID=A0A8D8P759_CULPI
MSTSKKHSKVSPVTYPDLTGPDYGRLRFTTSGNQHGTQRNANQQYRRTFSSFRSSQNLFRKGHSRIAFIRSVDDRVNCPEVVCKFIDDILNECLMEILSPILDDFSQSKKKIQQPS